MWPIVMCTCWIRYVRSLGTRTTTSQQLAMAPPLADGQVEYADGTPATVEQMSRDVTQFLTWASNPELEERKRMGIKVVLFLTLMTGLTYAVKRQIWSDVH